MRLDIRYRVHFHYAEAVSESQNEVRMRPRDDEHQSVLSYRLTSDPPTRVLHTHDYWGTAVDHLGVRTPHTELELVAEASVETSARPAPDASADAPAEGLSDPDFRSEHFEFLEPSEHVAWRPGDAVAERAAAVRSEAATAQALVVAVAGQARRALSYERGSTEIGVSLGELLDGGAGVCQDFAHLTIGMLRSVGAPARYVSGYLFAADESAPEGCSAVPAEAVDESASDSGGPEDAGEVRVQTHAWIEVALPGWGWWALDPTNGSEVGERHVVIGCGRDYGDVPPVRGTFTGAAAARVDAEVLIGTRPGAAASSFRRFNPPRVTVSGEAASPPPRRRDQQQQQQQ